MESSKGKEEELPSDSDEYHEDRLVYTCRSGSHVYDIIGCVILACPT